MREMGRSSMSEEEAIARGAAYACLDRSAEGFVRAYLRADPKEWFFCCASSCDPCVRTIARAVNHARDLLGLPIHPDL